MSARLRTAWPFLVLLTVVVAAAFTDGFATAANLKAILQAASLTGIVAVAMTPMTMSGNLGSLSTQQLAAMSSVVFAHGLASGWPLAVTLVLVVAIAMVAGAVQGGVVAAGLNPIITTLAAGSVVAGIVAERTETRNISIPDAPWWLGSGAALGLPIAIVYFAVVTVVLTWLMTRTVIGRRTLLAGANRNTAQLSGVPVGAVTVWAFVFLAVGTTIAGVLGAGRVGYANTTLQSSMTFDVIAAVVVGGVSVRGGYGSPLWAAGGAVLIAAIGNLCLLHDLSQGTRMVIVGALVVASIGLMQLFGERRTS